MKLLLANSREHVQGEASESEGGESCPEVVSAHKGAFVEHLGTNEFCCSDRWTSQIAIQLSVTWTDEKGDGKWNNKKEMKERKLTRKWNEERKGMKRLKNRKQGKKKEREKCTHMKIKTHRMCYLRRRGSRGKTLDLLTKHAKNAYSGFELGIFYQARKSIFTSLVKERILGNQKTNLISF